MCPPCFVFRVGFPLGRREGDQETKGLGNVRESYCLSHSCVFFAFFAAVAFL